MSKQKPDQPETKKTTASKKKYYPKDFLFEKTIQMLDVKKDTPRVVHTPITEHGVVFEGVTVIFKKDEAVSADDLKLMNAYQIKYYLK